MTAIRLSDLTPDQRRLVLALIDAKAAGDAAIVVAEAHHCRKVGCAGRRFDDHQTPSGAPKPPSRRGWFSALRRTPVASSQVADDRRARQPAT